MPLHVYRMCLGKTKHNVAKLASGCDVQLRSRGHVCGSRIIGKYVVLVRRRSGGTVLGKCKGLIVRGGAQKILPRRDAKDAVVAQIISAASARERELFPPLLIAVCHKLHADVGNRLAVFVHDPSHDHAVGSQTEHDVFQILAAAQ